MRKQQRRIWIDLANAPHVLVCQPVVERFRGDGWDVVLTARDHTQTLALARQRWGDDVLPVGGESPSGRAAKARAIIDRARRLRRFALYARPTVAFSHASYGQILAARAARVRTVTMMDYEHQPANHLSFRFAHRVIVPSVFPVGALRRYGASPAKVVRYEGFKEDLYLAGFSPDARVLDDLRLPADRVIAVMRTPPDGALYHRDLRGRFDELLSRCRLRDDVVTVLLPRTAEQAARYRSVPGVVIPDHPVDGPSLLACADLVIGGGGTMTREAALLGTPTYTVFAGALAAVDAELIRAGFLHDLRDPATQPVFEKRSAPVAPVPVARAEKILGLIVKTVADVTS